jgi:tetratricopeptide (TPR) repeat protein
MSPRADRRGAEELANATSLLVPLATDFNGNGEKIRSVVIELHKLARKLFDNGFATPSLFSLAYDVQAERVAAISNNPGLVEDAQFGRLIGGDLVSLSWYGLFSRRFEEAEKAARQSLGKWPDNKPALGNLAHALMFQGRKEEALRIYLQYSGDQMPEAGDRLWDDVVIEDFRTFEKAGVRHPFMEDVERQLRPSKPPEKLSYRISPAAQSHLAEALGALPASEMRLQWAAFDADPQSD